MGTLKNLPWGEKHLCGDYYTIKVKMGQTLYDMLWKDEKLFDIKSLSSELCPSKKSGVVNYIVYGVLNSLEYYTYLVTKEKCQLQIKAQELVNLQNQYKSHVDNLKHFKNEKAETVPCFDAV